MKETVSGPMRAALDRGAAMSPPPGSHDRVWSSVAAAAGISAVGAAGTAGLAGAATAGSGASAARAWAMMGAKLAVGSALVISVGYMYVRSAHAPAPARFEAQASGSTALPATPSESANEPTAEAPASPTHEPLARAVASQPGPSVSQSTRASANAHVGAKSQGSATAPAPGVAPIVPASRLQEETNRVIAARDDLRRGDPEAALRKLTALDGDIPRGALGEEREALFIEALAVAGRRDEAARRLDVFAQRHPSSDHVARLSALLKK
jgi:hypothetical protein